MCSRITWRLAKGSLSGSSDCAAGALVDSRLGPVQLCRKSGIRHIRISMKPFGAVVVAYPYHCSEKEALRFLEQKEEWIIKARKRLEKIEKQLTRFGPDTSFTTRFHTLSLVCSSEVTHFVLKQGHPSMRLLYPEGVDFASEQAQQIVRKALTEILRIEATGYLPDRVKRLAAIHGLTPAGVTIKDNSSRWGSCSLKNAIHLNLHLMRLPEALSDYVILHELAHFTQKNHGPAFWRLLDIYCNGQARSLDKGLKAYRIAIY